MHQMSAGTTKRALNQNDPLPVTIPQLPDHDPAPIPFTKPDPSTVPEEVRPITLPDSPAHTPTRTPTVAPPVPAPAPLIDPERPRRGCS